MQSLLCNVRDAVHWRLAPYSGNVITESPLWANAETLDELRMKCILLGIAKAGHIMFWDIPKERGQSGKYCRV